MKALATMRKLLPLVLIIALVISPLSHVLPVQQAEAATIVLRDGATYFTDHDNWGGGAADTGADGDLDVGLTNGTNPNSRYPVELKIENVSQLPTKSAHLLVRALDVDEYKPTISASGEWDRVYFSSNPSDIALGPNYTPFPTSNSRWNGLNATYKREIPQASYLGALSGSNEKWNTSVLPFQYNEFSRIAYGDNYVGITIHHYYLDTRATNGNTPNTGWQMTIDWVQLVIDGGARALGELTKADLVVEPGRVIIDTSFIPKISGNFSMEVSVIERALENGTIIERNVGLDKRLFSGALEGTEYEWNNIILSDSGINPSKEYVVNVILFEDRGGGAASENNTNPGEAQHVVQFSTHDPVVGNSSKSGYRTETTPFTPEDFKNNYFIVSGNAPNGDKLQQVQIITLPDAVKGKLQLNGADVVTGQEIATTDLAMLTFEPAEDGFEGTAEFEWNGFNGEKYANETGKVTINSSPDVYDFTIYAKKGESPIGFLGAGGLLDAYVDPGNELLEKVKIIDLPSDGTGLLVIQDGATITPVQAGEEISFADLSKLVFVPEQDYKGSASFTWNAYDGIQYAKNDATATILISEAPVVSGMSLVTELGKPVAFTAQQFNSSPYYVDQDGDSLDHVVIELPDSFAQLGKLTIQENGQETVLQSNTEYQLNEAQLNTLVFTPAAGLTDGATVTIPWFGNDGRYNSEQPAIITITMFGKPLADDKVITVDEGTATVSIIGSGSYQGSNDKISFGQIVQPPANGTVAAAPSGETDLELIYTVGSEFGTGKDTFTYTVKNEYGIESDPANVTIHVQKLLNGWIGDKQSNDPSVVYAIPGESLTLNAVSSHLAERVTVDIDGVEVDLTLANPDTWEQDGYKQWVNDSYVLPSTTDKGEYTPTFKATSSVPGYEQVELNVTDNVFEVLAPELTITASPDELVMDGKNQSSIVTVLTHEDGTPITNTEIELIVPTNSGAFIDPLTNEKTGTIKPVTDSDGKVTVIYQTELVMDVPEQQLQITAKVYDKAKGLKLEQKAELTLNPFVNTPPVVKGLSIKATVGQEIELSAAYFNDTAYYEDADGHDFGHAIIKLPVGFADHGILSYTDHNGMKIVLVAGTTYTLTEAELNSLVFTPSDEAVDGVSVVIPWSGYDGFDASLEPANIVIQYFNKPIADDKIVIVDEGALSATIVGSGSYNSSASEVEFGTIHTAPAKGTIEHDANNALKMTYKPNADFKLGNDRFTYTVVDQRGFESEPGIVTVHIQKKLNGWVGDKEPLDDTVVKVIPGEQLKLSATSSHLAEHVTAIVDGAEIGLKLANADTWEQDGYKQWINDSFVVPNEIEKGSFTVNFKATGTTSGYEQSDAELTDNKFEILAPELVLTAKPAVIIGDGKSTTELTAVLTEDGGKPVAGVEITFTAPVDGGSFIDPETGAAVAVIKATTNNQGAAVVRYQSSLVTGVNPESVMVSAEVFDIEKGLKADGHISITYMPAEIKGVLTEGGNNTAIANASITVSLDLNGDGVIDPAVDFIESVITDERGAYHMLVPRANAVYNVSITKNVVVDGTEVPVTYNQKANVGHVSGSGEEMFTSEKTIAGVVLLKDTEGNNKKLSPVITNQAAVFVKDLQGNYISTNGKPNAYPLDGQGVYAIEGLDVGEYVVEIRYEYEPEKYIVFATNRVQVTASGEMNITEELVDPYGTITDGRTGEVIEGAKVQLYYADTERNRNKNIQVRTPVHLPEIVGFEPNDNKSPDQLTDVHGFYAYMVYPETDYYLVISSPGYTTHTSNTISVEWDIVRYDAALYKALPISNIDAYQPSINGSLDEKIVHEGNQTTLAIQYKNGAIATLPEGIITLEIPADVKVIDANGGVLEGGVLTWKITNLAPNASGQFKVVLEWPFIDQAEKVYTLNGRFITGNDSASFAAKVNVYSERYDDLHHYRYILGYPDQEFKPNRSMTRAELAAIVARLTLNEEIDYQLPYNDIREGHWATNYIKIATKYGFFQGSSDGAFRPDEPITRAELATVMGRFLEIKADQAIQPYFKDTTGHWAGAMIEALYANKFLKGYPDGTFKPNEKIIRVEAVTMINSMLYRGPLLGLDPLFPDMPDTHWGFGQVQEATISHTATRNSDGSEQYTGKLEDQMR